MRLTVPAALVLAAALSAPALSAQQQPAPSNRFTLRDIFDLQWVADPQVAPDGKRVVFERTGYDIMKDRRTGSLWIVNTDGSDLRPLLDPGTAASSPVWSPDGTKLLYVARGEEGAEIFLHWMDTGQNAVLTHLTQGPGSPAWSPDGKWIAFTMFVPDKRTPLVHMPRPPKGANWGPAWKYIDQLKYRADGRGYLTPGHRHIFVIPAEGGAPRQLTDGPYDDGAPVWSNDGKSILFSGNRHANAEYAPNNSEIYEVSLADGAIKALTSRQGPDREPTISPDGKLIAYTGFDDHYQGYQNTHLYIMNRDGSGSHMVSGSFDHPFRGLVWSANGKGLYFEYPEQADNKIGYITLDGHVTTVASDVNGLSVGRPYTAGQYSITPNGVFAFTQGASDHPPDLAVGSVGHTPQRLTNLNGDFLGHKQLGHVEETWWQSSYDHRKIEGWIVTPPDFDPHKKYPFILEIHGGPYDAYGPTFAAEIQLYAAAGYVVLYSNPRGSSSYGEKFGNLIHLDYPDHDYDDLMSGVDAVIAKGYVDTTNLFVTGGSGGGVLSAWIVGHTHRFRAAVVVKPVINWYSFVLTADGPAFFYKYWFDGFPWDHLKEYMDRSPITYVKNVTTPTMLMTGEEDYRVPNEEPEQFYEGLKLNHVPAAMVRIPDASHNIAGKPSNMMEKVAYILAWFEKYRK